MTILTKLIKFKTMPMEILHNLCLIISEKTFSSLNRQKKAFQFLPEKQHLGNSKT